MDRYPEHRFVVSQAQQMKWLEQQYPQLFDVIRSVSLLTHEQASAERCNRKPKKANLCLSVEAGSRTIPTFLQARVYVDR